MDQFEWGNPKIMRHNGVYCVILPVDRYNELLEQAGMGFSVDVKSKGTEGKPQKARMNVDKGKIKALHDAGWNVFDIAKDMKISVSTVYNNLPPLKK